MPHKVLSIVVDDEPYAKAWETLASWCYMASQGNKDGESLVSFSIKAITEVKD